MSEQPATARHSATFWARGIQYRAVILDEEDLPLDPTFLLFRGDEEEAIVTAHLNPATRCTDPGHVIVRPPE